MKERIVNSYLLLASLKMYFFFPSSPAFPPMFLYYCISLYLTSIILHFFCLPCCSPSAISHLFYSLPFFPIQKLVIAPVCRKWVYKIVIKCSCEIAFEFSPSIAVKWNCSLFFQSCFVFDPFLWNLKGNKHIPIFYSNQIYLASLSLLNYLCYSWSAPGRF